MRIGVGVCCSCMHSVHCKYALLKDAALLDRTRFRSCGYFPWSPFPLQPAILWIFAQVSSTLHFTAHKTLMLNFQYCSAMHMGYPAQISSKTQANNVCQCRFPPVLASQKMGASAVHALISRDISGPDVHIAGAKDEMLS